MAKKFALIKRSESGFYTPVAGIVANLDAVIPEEAQYMRIGNVVHVAGRVQVDPTSASTLTRLTLTLPIPSEFDSDGDAAGTAFSRGMDHGAEINADAGNNLAELSFLSNATVSNQSMYYTYTYKVL